MTGQYFEFDGISSKDLGLMIVSFDGAKNGVESLGNNISYNTIKLPNSNKWVKTSASYNEVLSFSFQVAKLDCNSNDVYISERELSYYIRWLVRKDYKYLRIIQDEYENIYYHAQLNVQKYEVGGQIAGLEITVTCDAPFGYSGIKNYQYTSSALQGIFELYDDSDEIGYIYPDTVEITVLQDGNVELKNNMENRATTIKNCKTGDVIVFTSGLKAYIDGSTTSIADHFNWKFPRLCNTFDNRINVFETTNIQNINIAWRAIRKAVC